MRGIEKRFYSFNKKFQEKIIDKIDERIFYWKKIMPYCDTIPFLLIHSIRDLVFGGNLQSKIYS